MASVETTGLTSSEKSGLSLMANYGDTIKLEIFPEPAIEFIEVSFVLSPLFPVTHVDLPTPISRWRDALIWQLITEEPSYNPIAMHSQLISQRTPWHMRTNSWSLMWLPSPVSCLLMKLVHLFSPQQVIK